MELLKAVDSWTAPTTAPTKLAADSSSASLSPGRWPTNPTLILADEPTANLDTENGRQVMDVMKRLNKETGVTFVFATHDPRVIGYADRVVTLQDGLITKDSKVNGKS